MQFVSHPLIKPEKIESRSYQESILNTATRRNTLCVLPTGLGKTTVAALVAAPSRRKPAAKPATSKGNSAVEDMEARLKAALK